MPSPMPSPTHKVDHFDYFVPHKPEQKLKPHHTRDGAAFNELLAALTPRGYEYGDLILNFPPEEAPTEEAPAGAAESEAEDDTPETESATENTGEVTADETAGDAAEPNADEASAEERTE